MEKEKSKYTEETAKAIILSNRGRIESKKITIQQPGIRLLGVIDYLVGKHKYVWVEGVRWIKTIKLPSLI